MQNYKVTFFAIGPTYTSPPPYPFEKSFCFGSLKKNSFAMTISIVIVITPHSKEKNVSWTTKKTWRKKIKLLVRYFSTNILPSIFRLNKILYR